MINKVYSADYSYIVKSVFSLLIFSIFCLSPIKTMGKLIAILVPSGLFIVAKLFSIHLVSIEINYDVMYMNYRFIYFFKWQTQVLISTSKFELKYIPSRSFTSKNLFLRITNIDNSIIEVSSESSGWSNETINEIYHFLQNQKKSSS